MFTKTFTTALLVGSAAAAPALHARQNGTLAADAKFGLMAIRSGSPIQFAAFDAAKKSLFVGLPAQNASCDQGPADSATFTLSDGGLFLYAASATPQQLYVDASGMGQGVIQYTTGAEPMPTNAQRGTFALDANNDLTFNGASFIACPNSIDGAYSVWVSAGVENPAGQTGCLGISAKAVEIANPQSCVYTQ